MGDKSRMPHVKALVDAFKVRDDRNDSWVSAKLGKDRRLLSSWWSRGLSEIPSAQVLYALSTAIDTPYRDVLDAALEDFGYLPEAAVRSLTLLEDVGEDVPLANIETRPS